MTYRSDDEAMEVACINQLLAAMAAAERMQDNAQTAQVDMALANPVDDVEVTPQFKQD